MTSMTHTNIFMIFSLLLIALFNISVYAQCPPPTVEVHEMFSAGGTFTIMDANGQRQIKAAAYSVNGCEGEAGKTGVGTAQGTRIQRTAVEAFNENCYVPLDSSTRQFRSFRGLVIRNNGWRSTATFNLKGVSTGVFEQSYIDIVAVVGFDGTSQVNPTITSSSVYLQRTATVSGSAIGALGIPVGDVSITSVEYALTEKRVCWNNEAEECKIIVRFNERVDTIAVLFGTIQVSEYSATSSFFMSGIEFGCECRCSEMVQGTREITVPIPGLTNECIKSTTSNPKLECDMLGMQWCDQQTFQRYAISGTQMPSGNYPCEVSTGITARVIEPFTEITPF